jgi:hypothetical protein
MSETFLGEIILESLSDITCLNEISGQIIKAWTTTVPDATLSSWTVHRYRISRAQVLNLTPLLEQSFSSGEWYIHFFSESGNDLFVIMKERTFKLPKQKDVSWNEMIQYGESIGLGRKWTENIPVEFGYV